MCTTNASLNIIAEFSNFHYGIYAAATNTTTQIDVENSEFIGNFKGLYISGMEGAQITSNNFEINDASINLGYGMYLDNCNGYTVKENQLIVYIKPSLTINLYLKIFSLYTHNPGNRHSYPIKSLILSI